MEQQKTYTAEEIKWLLNKYEKCSDRYMEAEKFIMELKWYQRIFCSKKIINFLKSREKYGF